MQAPPLRVIRDPATFVMVVPDAPGGLITDHDRDVFAAARILADACEAAVLAIADIASGTLAEVGADRVIGWPQGTAADVYCPEKRIAFLRAVEVRFEPLHVLFSNSGDGRDLALRLAAELRVWPMTDIHRMRAGEVARLLPDGAIEAVAAPGRVLTIAAGAAEPLSGQRFEALVLEAPIVPDTPTQVRDQGLLPADPAKIPLEEAPFVIGAGNGLRDWPGFQTLVRLLRAAPAGTRVVCDSGNLPRECQVGTSGRTIAAECYLALGVSGAIQHVQGIERCARVVAVNIDDHAPIVERADLMVVGDANQILAALVRRLQDGRPCK
jgi:electron transfer flavoprotein alpha subunit